MNENHLPRKYTGKGGLFHAMVTRIERSENLREFFVDGGGRYAPPSKMTRSGHDSEALQKSAGLQSSALM